MTNASIGEATDAYEAWLRSRICLVEEDLGKKHKVMAKGAFEFLRASYYRWVLQWPERCARSPRCGASGVRVDPPRTSCALSGLAAGGWRRQPGMPALPGPGLLAGRKNRARSEGDARVSPYLGWRRRGARPHASRAHGPTRGGRTRSAPAIQRQVAGPPAGA
jgi:hypothetical protein